MVLRCGAESRFSGDRAGHSWCRRAFGNAQWSSSSTFLWTGLCLRNAFETHSGAARVPVEMRIASGTHLRHTVELFVSRWWSAVPHGRICVTQWSCSCPGGGPQCLRDAFCVTQWSCSRPGWPQDLPLNISRVADSAAELWPCTFAWSSASKCCRISEKMVGYRVQLLDRVETSLLYGCLKYHRINCLLEVVFPMSRVSCLGTLSLVAAARRHYAGDVCTWTCSGTKVLRLRTPCLCRTRWL